MGNFDLTNSGYFKSLPMVMQESIIQSGIKFNNEEDVRKFVSNIK